MLWKDLIPMKMVSLTILRKEQSIVPSIMFPRWHIWKWVLNRKLILFFSLLGCDELGMKSVPQAQDSSEQEIVSDIRVDLISPNIGALSGGTSVNIHGAGFEGDIIVYFGNISVDVTKIDSETLVLSSPSSSVEQSVDVIVE